MNVNNYKVQMNLSLSKDAYEAVHKAARAASVRMNRETGLKVEVAPSALIESLVRKSFREHFKEA